MSLLIQNMDMPCMCCLCPCHDWDMETNRYYCLALKDEPRIIDENTRRDDCPLVEISAPHGRLIDADKAAVTILMMSNHPCGHAIENISDVVDWLRIKDNNIAFPTIIEAEE